MNLDNILAALLEITIILIFIGVAYNKFKNKKINGQNN